MGRPNRLWNNHPRERKEVLLTESFLSGLGKALSRLQGKNVLADRKITSSTAQKPKTFLFPRVAILFRTKPSS